MKKYIIYVLVLLMALTNVNGFTCYQETANISTPCGGLDTGNYTKGGLAFTVPWQNSYDEDYDTFAQPNGGGTSNAYMNYTIPSGLNWDDINSTIWVVKLGDKDPGSNWKNITINATLNSSCFWDNITLNLETRLIWVGNRVELYCRNQAGTYIASTENRLGWRFSTYQALYEEAMYWEISSVNYTFIFRDEQNNSILSRDIEFDIISNIYNNNYTVQGGILSESLNFSNYTFRYKSEGYAQRSRVIELTEYTDSNITLYLANYSSTRDITFTVINEFDNAVDGALIEIDRFFIADGEFRTIASFTTNINGEISVPLVPETELYRYRVYYENQLKWNRSAINGDPVYPEDTEYTFNIVIGDDIYELKDKLDGISTFLDFYINPLNNRTGYFNLTFASVETETVCLQINNISDTTTTLNDSCITSTSGLIQTWYTPVAENSSAMYQALALLNYDGNRYILASDTVLIESTKIINPFNPSVSFEGWFWAIMGILLITIGFAGYPEAVVIGAGLVTAILIRMNVIYLNPGYKIASMVGVMFLSFIIAGLVYQGGKK